MSDIKDFTEPKQEPKRFKIDNDVFECASVLPAGAATFLSKMAQADTVTQLTMVGTFLDMIIMPDSSARFAERIKDPANPISAGQLGNVLRWLLEEYGAFPTQQSSTSVSGETPTGTSSTAGAPLAV